MKLVEAQIENYKIIEDSTPFAIDQVTCLVGKNESGKTALLEALYKLNPVEDDKEDFDEVDFPRRKVSEYRERSDANKHAHVLTTKWDLDDIDVEEMQKVFGHDLLTSRTVTARKGYDNKITWELSLKHADVARHYVDSSNLNEREKSDLSKVASISDLITALKAITEPSEAQTQLLALLERVFPKGSLTAQAGAFLEGRLPTFVYFNEYFRMPGKVALTQVATKKQNQQLTREDKVFLAFLDLARSSVDDMASIGTSEHLIMELEAVSNRITDEIFQYWSQNSYLRVQFRCDQARPQDQPPYNQGFIFSTRIENQRHRVSVNFDERSTGFIWFFSFLVWFSQVRKNYGKNLFLLLDEPGLTLHGKAQADLLRYINEKLRPNYQVIYTTHSPFMVDPENLLSARTVEDKVSRNAAGGEVIEGTKVGSKVLSTDADTLLPLQGALGFDITQTLFVGPNTLLVEGPSDLLYLKTMSSELHRLGRVGLDLRWTIAPAGGLDKVQSFVILFSGKIRNIAVLTDMGAGDKTKVRKLREHELLKAGRVFSADDYAGQDEADVEDLFGRALYAHLIKECYSLKKAECLPTKRPASAPIRCVKEVEDHLRVMPDKPEFDHFEPSRFFVENVGSLKASLPDWDDALNRFEALFKDLNAVLPTKD